MNLEIILTSLSFIICAILFYRKSKTILITSHKNGEKKSKTLKMCSIILIFIAVGGLFTFFIPDSIKWRVTENNQYAASIKGKRLNVMTFTVPIDDPNNFYDQQKTRLEYLNYEVSFIKKDNTKIINKYINSLKKQYPVSSNFVLLVVEETNEEIIQYLYIGNCHQKIMWEDFFLLAKKRK